ncbi:MAG: ABC transporter substrate-binding protein [Caldilineaceae bacterium]|nr:ABC transporter substrate-binding protein [Caldilineaceae bacterium]
MAQHRRFQHAFAVLILGLLAVALAACAPVAAPTAPAAGDAPAAVEDPMLKTLVVAVDSDPANLEPGTNRAFPIGSEMIVNIFDTLVAWAPPDFGTLEGRLAESWSVSDDGLTYTFNLRSGVTFHDGTEFNADAVKFSFERTLELNSFMTAYFGPITEMTVVDPLTIEITLERPSAVFLSWLAMPQAAVVSPAAAEEFGEAFNVNPVGTGPFKFVSYTPDTEVVLEANADYFRGAPQLDTIIYRIIPDAATRRLEIENGTVDIVQQNGQLFSLPVEDIAALNENPDVNVIELDSQIIRNIDFNNNNPDSVLNDVTLRRAIGYAIDYDGLINDLLGGTASRVYGPLTTSSWGYNPAVEDLAFTYDPDRSRELLAEAGVEPGELNLTLYSFQGSLWGSIGTFVQANLADVGINAELMQMEFPPYRDLHTAGEHDIALDGRQPWYNDPDAHITIGYLSELAGTAMNFRMSADAELDQMILDAQTAPDQASRKALYDEIQIKLMEKVPGIYLFSPKIIIYARANVDGLAVNSAPPLTEYWGVSKSAE